MNYSIVEVPLLKQKKDQDCEVTVQSQTKKKQYFNQ